ncbi:MAG: transposase [Patescibacteria group bacterium]|nr:transposase [Patescibacteria group bacterium]
MGRIIGIVHRVKQLKAGEARPTKVWIDSGSGYDLETETDELDWLLGRFPVKFRAVAKDEEVKSAYPWQIVKDKDGTAKKIPIEWDGLKAGDTVVMCCGGSGDRLAYAIARRGEKIGAEILRLAPFRLKYERAGNNKDNDRQLLVFLYAKRPELFQQTGSRDLELIRVREMYFGRQEAMAARMGCAQRLSQRFIGSIFLNEEGNYPEGILEEQFDRVRASDTILSLLAKEESRREKELKEAVRAMPVWQKIFEQLEGVGEMIAARLITAVGDIRRFENDSKFKAYLGAHVLADGRFPRQRNSELANWNNEARQALYLLGDQFNRRPDSVWGRRLREYKLKLRAKHPDILCQQCGSPWESCPNKKTHKRIYSDGHIHRMATWRTLTKFAEKLFHDWKRLEGEVEVSAKAAA